jgi:hypothetical protein
MFNMPMQMGNGPQGAPMGPGGPMPPMMDPDMIGAIKIKDGLFIGDELASTVSFRPRSCD